METLILRDVRCFRGEHRIKLAPITLLVGENSTGKSTLLALTRLAWDVAFRRIAPDFNEEPFQLGSFHEILHDQRGRRPSEKTFVVGTCFQPRNEGIRAIERGVPGTTAGGTTSVWGEFSSSAGQPSLTSVRVERTPWGIESRLSSQDVLVSMTTPRGTSQLSLREVLGLRVPGGASLVSVLDHATDLSIYLRVQKETVGTGSVEANELVHIEYMLAGVRHHAVSLSGSEDLSGRPLAIAPVRSRPRRTYDPTQEIRSPEGEHVPMLLNRLSATHPSAWRELADGLSGYGRASGLFEEVEIRRFAQSTSDPFQITVRLKRQRRRVNLVDVGYGVSQVLPLLVDALSERRPRTFLMQQPEVHLHPRAQAELGSFLVHLAETKGHRFLVETHSDYLLDRLRLMVRQRKLKPDLVAIHYLERAGSEVNIFPLTLDANGNVLGAPETYRSFFLEEELRLLS